MNTLEKLIAQLCPDGVEYKPLGEVLKYEQPTKYIVHSTEYDDSYTTPVLTAGQSFILGYTDEADNHYQASKESPVIIFDDFTTATQWVDFEFKVKSSAMKILSLKNRDVADIRFIYFAIQCIGFTPGEHTRHWIEKYSRFEIPLPPLSVQKEIVRMLDDMAGLIDSLEEELAARKKQYEWCRERLLRIKDGDESYKLSLGEVCEVLDNSRVPVSRKNRKVGPYPYYGANGIQDYVDSYIFDGTFLLIGEDGSVINGDGSPVLNWVEGKVWVNNHAHVLKGTDKADLRYLFYILQTIDISAMVRGTPPKLNQENLKRITVTLPPLSEQRRIVKILDNIDTLCNSMTEGLPGEIALRKQQYEFYRDKLLTFKKAV